jgi:hypothetical protein
MTLFLEYGSPNFLSANAVDFLARGRFRVHAAAAPRKTALQWRIAGQKDLDGMQGLVGATPTAQFTGRGPRSACLGKRARRRPDRVPITSESKSFDPDTLIKHPVNHTLRPSLSLKINSMCFSFITLPQVHLCRRYCRSIWMNDDFGLKKSRAGSCAYSDTG